MESKWLALLLAPILGPLIWAAFYWLAKKGHDYLWRRIPDGRLRSLLFRKV